MSTADSLLQEADEFKGLALPTLADLNALKKSAEGIWKTVKTAAKPHKSKVATAVLALYSRQSVSNQDIVEIITEFYADNAVFDDPIVRTQGQDKIISQFIALKQMCSSYEVTDVSVWSSHKKLLLETSWRIRLPVIPILTDIKMFTKIVLNDEGKIVLHQELWSMYDLLSNLSPLAALDNFRRVSVANAVNWFFKAPSKPKSS